MERIAAKRPIRFAGLPARAARLVGRTPLVATAAVFVVLYLVASTLYKGFATPGVFINFLADNSFLGIVAVGMTLVVISGGIDLSVGGVLALCCVVMAKLMLDWHVPPVVAWVASLVIGTSLGFLMGCIIRFFKVEPFIATLAGMVFARGLARIISPQSIPIEHPFYTRVSEAGIGLGSAHVPVTALVFLAVVAIGTCITTYTPFGRNLYAIGGSEDAATMMGLPVGRTKLAVYTLSGFCAGLAAIVLTIYQPSGDPTAGIGMELDAIAASVIGGTLLTGGAGSVIGTLIGVLIFGVVQTGITFQGTLNSWWTKVAIGTLLLIFIVLQRFIARGTRRRA